MKKSLSEHRAAFVDKILRDCLYREEEIPDGKVPADAIIVDGIVNKFGFHPGRVLSHAEDIRLACTGLPKEFYFDSGGGWSFPNLCVDAEGQKWGEHINIEHLCVLAIASGLGRWQMPREMWSILPGGMPYFVFTFSPNGENDLAEPHIRQGEMEG